MDDVLMLTAERLKQLLSYDADSGLFYWRQKSGPRSVVGKVAGSVTQGYINISVDGRLYRAHRLAWLYANGAWPEKNIDHANGNGCDNRICNLREADQSQNTANARRRLDSKSGLKGAVRYRGRWVATIAVNGKKKHIGVFDTAQEAHEAYMTAAKAIFGEFARAA